MHPIILVRFSIKVIVSRLLITWIMAVIRFRSTSWPLSIGVDASMSTLSSQSN
ncbi:MAG: hypothetical protein WC763_04315 [Candidatus Paceibacterota bacterium]